MRTEAWAGHQSALLWAAFVGMVGTSGAKQLHESHRCFAGVFSAALVGQALDTRAEIQQLLETFLWRNKCCLPVLDAWWESGEAAWTDPVGDAALSSDTS